jgi:NodT family efflux transporter outer membrane factor (OMF) lipoprotein
MLTLTLGACGALPTPTLQAPDYALPLTWSGADQGSATAADSLVAWWLRFDDRQLSLLIGQALLRNTSVKMAQAALNQARAQSDVAGAALWPTLGSAASVQASRNGDNSSNNFKLGLDASWELDVFGANRNGVNASEATAQASAASLGQVRVSVAAEVALDYIALRSAQQRLAIAQANLTNQSDTWQITQWRFQAGLVTTLEEQQARAAVEQTAAQLPALQTTITQSSHALAVLTGQPPAALLATLDASGPLPLAPQTLALAIPAETLRQRSDVRAAEYQVVAAAARISQAEAARLPSFRLGGSLGLSALTLGALTDVASLAAALLASVSMPVFDAGAAGAQVRVQEAALAQSEAAYQGTLLTALTEVEDALVALRGDRLRLLHLQIAFEAADSAALLARQRYSSGLVDFQTVLETQRTRLGTQDSVAVAQAAISADHVRLYKALGGGWQPQEQLAAPNPATELLRTPTL